MDVALQKFLCAFPILTTLGMIFHKSILVLLKVNFLIEGRFFVKFLTLKTRCSCRKLTSSWRSGYCTTLMTLKFVPFSNWRNADLSALENALLSTRALPNLKGVQKMIIGFDRGKNVRTPGGYSDLAEKTFSSVSCHVVRRSPIPYTHCILECKKL